MAKKFVTPIIFGLIILVYVLVRLPVFNQPFGVELHGDKYATYLPTVLNMYFERNPFLNRNPNYSSILDPHLNPGSDQFQTAPIGAWMLLPLLPLSNLLGLEQTVRWVQTLYGAGLLVLLYLVLRKTVGNSTALFTTLFISVNPFFQLATLLTTHDLPALIFLFGAVFFWQRQNKPLAFLLAGFSVMTKYAFLLISPPLFVVLILFQSRHKLYGLLELAFLSLTPLVLFKFLLAGTPSDSLIFATVRLVVFGLAIWFCYYSSKKFKPQLRPIVYRINPMWAVIVLVLGGVLGGFIFQSEIAHFAPEFLTDRYLILNFPMYREILRQSADSVGLPGLLYLYLIVIITGVTAAIKQPRAYPLIALSIGVVTYLILASKSIFVHFYYRHLFVVLFFWALAIVVRTWSRVINKHSQVLLGLVLTSLAAVLVPVQIKQVNSYLQVNPVSPTIRQVGAYLNQTLQPNEKTLGPEILNVYTQRTVIDPSDMSFAERQVLYQGLQQNELATILSQYQVVLYVTPDSSNFDSLWQLTEEPQAEIVSPRTQEILRQLGQDTKPVSANNQLVLQSESTPSMPVPHLEKSFAGWYIYRLHERDL